jgi:adenine deaminase
MDIADIIAVARGDKEADLILRNARIINTFNGSIEEGNVAISGNRIAGIGDYNKSTKTIDLKGKYLAPGLINGHTHVESSMLHPARYAAAVIPRGTTSLMTDLHEIVNVCGIKGLEFYRSWAEKLPVDMFFMVPSCVPATHMETSGAEITPDDIRKLLELPNVLGLGEMMNFPGVIFGDPVVLQKIINAGGRVINGHAPMVSGKQLNAYISAGISSDHESTGLEEAREKLAKGLHLMIREGSTEKNLEDLLPLVTDSTYKRCMFVVDDRSCSDILSDGDIDAVVRKAIALGLDPVRAIQLASINTAEHFRVFDRGAIAPGYIANMIIISDLDNLIIDTVYYQGNPVAEDGKLLEQLPAPGKELTDTINIKPFSVESLEIKTNNTDFPVIGIVPGQIITKRYGGGFKPVNGKVEPDLERDILKLVVVERHKATGNIGLGMVNGFGLKKGALASSVAHDSHNIIAVGTNDNDIYEAINDVARNGGGLTVCNNGNILASLPLPVGGLLSAEPLKYVVSQHDKIDSIAASLGNLPVAPFALLSFLALPVIPELKLTDKGIVDVVQFKIIEQ